jgi:hypothetical protein
MSEAKRVVAGEAILSGLATIQRNEAERSRAESSHDVLERLVREHSRLVYRIAYAVLRSHNQQSKIKNCLKLSAPHETQRRRPGSQPSFFAYVLE